jgi:hypothetical protein
VASILAANGIATIAINTVSSGGGPLSNLVVTTGSTSVTLPSGGRTLDVNGDGIFTDQENFVAAAPRTIISGRDTRRQTMADLMQLVRVIQVGVDVDGDGIRDLDPSRVYYFGVSLGGNNGVVFLAMEPDVHAGVPNAFGGHAVDANRLSPGARDSLGAVLFARTPSLLNQGPPDLVNGIFPFNENLPLRNQPSVINTVAGAIDIQKYFTRMRWVGFQVARRGSGWAPGGQSSAAGGRRSLALEHAALATAADFSRGVTGALDEIGENHDRPAGLF